MTKLERVIKIIKGARPLKDSANGWHCLIIDGRPNRKSLDDNAGYNEILVRRLDTNGELCALVFKGPARHRRLNKRLESMIEIALFPWI